MKPFVYLLNVFDGQGWVEDISLLDNPGDAERVVDFSETLQCELEQCYIVCILRDVCSQELDPLAIVL